MSNLKKVLALVLVLALSLTMFAGAIETVLPYDDVDELTAEQLDALQLLYALGVIKGDDENSVNPTDTLTRGELCAILYRLYTGDAEEKYVSTYSTDCPYFDDVEDGKWYVPYVNWAYIKGVVAGYGNGKFGPTDNVDGVQAATMLARLVGYEIGSENWELVARKHAIELGLDDGVSSKDLFGTDLSRGDMIVMVANVLDCYEVGTKVTLAEKIFDLEIIRGAILLGADKLGSTDYSVFAFKDEISGNVKYFITDLLSIEEKPTVDEIGQKYTLYVAKNTEKNGYKILYAAYEEAENAYYKTVTGTIDDGKLNVTDATKKETYLLNLLDDHVIAYINGEVVANNASDAFAAFKASYGLKNSAAYKLIDNDGDGKYEYIFIERLTLANMKTTEVVANVVAYNNITGAYTLSDGKEYVPGQYWGVDKDNKITNSVINAEDAIFDAIGKDGFTASSVQFKFTIENGKYIMKAEICDETYFAGNYVLSMGVVGTSTYKGMQYVQFLTEDNTTLYAYVSKIDHNDVRPGALWNDNNPWAGLKYLHELYYINAYGDDTVEIFTPDYVNSNYVNEVQKPEDVTLLDNSVSEVVLPAVGNVYTRIDAKLGDKGGFIPAEPFNANRAYFIKVGENYRPVVFSQSTYAGYFAQLAAGSTETLKQAEAALEAEKLFQVEANKILTLWDAYVKTKDFENGTIPEAETAAWDALVAQFVACGYAESAADVLTAYPANTQLGTKDDLYDTKAECDAVRADLAKNLTADLAKRLAAAEKAVEDAKKDVTTIGSDVYYLSAMGKDAVKLSVDVKVTYDSDEYQLFKAYGTWYVQSYADNAEKMTFEVYFTVDGKTTGVKYDETLKRFYVYDYVADAFVKDPNTNQNMIFNIGSADEEDLHGLIDTAIDSLFDEYSANNNHAGTNPGDYIWNTAKAVNTSKGVVFAYGQYPVDGVYRWRAYNFDEFNVNFFGQGGANDDNTALNLADEMIYTVSNGNVYAKAMKVTVNENPAEGKKWDTLPMGWMVKNSMVFVYGMQRGTITTEGETVQAILPNGATKDVFIPYGMLNTNRPNENRYGNVYYAVLSEKGDVISVEYICNIFDVLNTGANDLPLLTNDSFKDYAADGTVTLQGKLGLTYTAKIDLTKSFFTVPDANGTDRFVSSEDFAKYLDNNNVKFEIRVDAYGYNYASIK